jgi:hypothetical protein
MITDFGGVARGVRCRRLGLQQARERQSHHAHAAHPQHIPPRHPLCPPEIRASISFGHTFYLSIPQ